MGCPPRRGARCLRQLLPPQLHLRRLAAASAAALAGLCKCAGGCRRGRAAAALPLAAAVQLLLLLSSGLGSL
eukprot:4934814-Alexandrium_andersonii.AAC.1